MDEELNLDNLNRPLTPVELQELKRRQTREKAERELEVTFTRSSVVPAELFGRLVGLGAVCFFLDATGWVTMFFDGRLYYLLSVFLKVGWSVCILGIAGLSIYGTIQAYRHQEALKELRARLDAEEARE